MYKNVFSPGLITESPHKGLYGPRGGVEIPPESLVQIRDKTECKDLWRREEVTLGREASEVEGGLAQSLTVESGGSVRCRTAA